jgi:hypothetical protein
VGRGQAAPENPPARQDPQVEAGAPNPTAAPDAAAAFFHAAGKASPQAAADGGAAQIYQVALTDEDGNITAVQKFDTLEKAQSFAAEVTRWQARHEQIQNGRVLVKTSKF